MKRNEKLRDNICIAGMRAVTSPSQYNREHFDRMARGGLDLADVRGELPEGTEEPFRLAAEAGIRLLVSDPRLGEPLELEPAALRAVLEDYQNREEICGIDVKDQPWAANRYAPLIRRIQALAPSLCPDLNFAADVRRDGYHFDRLDDYCRLLYDKEGLWLSFNDYPFLEEPGLAGRGLSLRPDGHGTAGRAAQPYPHRLLCAGLRQPVFSLSPDAAQ